MLRHAVERGEQPVPSSELVARLHLRLAEFRGLASASDDVSFIIAQVSSSASECA